MYIGQRTTSSVILRNVIRFLWSRVSCAEAHPLCYTSWLLSPKGPPLSTPSAGITMHMPPLLTFLCGFWVSILGSHSCKALSPAAFYKENVFAGIFLSWDRVLALSLLCSQRWPRTADSPTSTSRVLGLQAQFTTLSFKGFVFGLGFIFMALGIKPRALLMPDKLWAVYPSPLFPLLILR